VEADVNGNGPLARSLDDLELALDVVAGPLPAEAAGWRLELGTGLLPGDVGALRVGTVFGEGAEVVPLAADVRAALDGFAGRLADAGARVEAIDLPVPLAEGLRSWQELVLPVIGTGLPDDAFAAFAELDALEGDDPMLVAGRSLAGRYRSWARADSRRQHQRVAWAECFEQVDLVLAPVMPTAAFPHDVERPMTDRVLDVDGAPVPHLVAMAWCGAIGSVLLPVVTLPTGPTPEGLPVGVQVIGPFLSDRRLLRLAGLVDRAAGPGFTPPPV
jgi:amidase